VIEPNENELDLADTVIDRPQTGYAAIDDALLGVADLMSTPLADHHDRLAQAHEVLHDALDRSDGDRFAGDRTDDDQADRPESR
jgi:hypothetical protein